jgi:hypothetical protein
VSNIDLDAEILKRNFAYGATSISVVNELISIGLLEAEKDYPPAKVFQTIPQIILTTYSHSWESVLDRCNLKTWEDICNVIYFLVEIGIFMTNENDDKDAFRVQETTNPLWKACKKLEQEGFLTNLIENSLQQKNVKDRKCSSST